MKLVYWKIAHIADCDAYSIRAKTKKEALKMLKEKWNPQDFDKVVARVEMEYSDAFDLAERLLGEGGEYGVGKEYKIK